jgi:hypothetical protein
MAAGVTEVMDDGTYNHKEDTNGKDKEAAVSDRG